MKRMKQIFLITGETGSGKTSLVLELLTEIHNKGIKTTGIYSPARIEKGVKTGIFAVDISTEAKKLLAIHQPGWDIENPIREWKIDPKVLNWGNDVIQKSVPTNILIIDELGYLEFEKNKGWISAFKILDKGDYKSAIVVVRTGLLENALAKFENAVVITIADPAQTKENASFLVAQTLAI